MRLQVDDFGCVPDGRVLERVAVAAGSAVLTDPDGDLRETDVGKNIAVPGADDLMATIVRLVDRTDVKDASMAAGQTTLTANFTKPSEGFRADLHTGQRIAVNRAGPAGQPLLTDVSEVVNRTTLRLADAASTTAAGVEATLNRPDVVGLSNHARRSVADVTVDLGDRVINDARMTIGGRGLESQTAKFSLLDLPDPFDVPKPPTMVMIQAAGLFVTTIQSVDSPTRATLADPAQRTVEEVLADVWRTDSRPGLELLLASLDSQNTESAEICFGPGVYDFTRAPRTPGAQPAAIGLRGLRNLTVRGAGPGATVLRLMPGQDLDTDTHVIETVDCRNLTLRDLSVHGAYLTLGNAVEQMHGIHLNEGSEEIAVRQVRVFQSAGDGIRLLGRPDSKVRKVWVEGCRFIQNKRTGVGFQRDAEFVWVRDCYIEMTPPSSDQCVDFEPSGSGAPTDIIIESNVLVHETGSVAVAISGISGGEPVRRVTFAHNILLGGEVFCTDVAELTIQHNVVLVPASDRPGRFVLNLQHGGDSVLVTGNLLISEHDGTAGAIHFGVASNRQVSRALIAGNLCVVPAGDGIQAIGSDDVAIEGNMLVATGPCTNGVNVHSSQASAVNGVAVRNNDILVKDSGSWATGILFSGDEVHHVCAVGNSVRGAANGIEFRGSGFRQTPVCALNRTEADVASPLVGLGRLPERAIVVGGAASRGGSGPGSGAGRSLAGQGSPEGMVAGNVGDVYQRVDPEPGPRLFVKESDEQPNTGWSAT